MRRSLSIWTNPLYSAAGLCALVAGALRPGLWLVLLGIYAASLVVLTGGSWRFHETLSAPDRIADRMGMLLVAVATPGLVAGSLLPAGVLYVAAIVLVLQTVLAIMVRQVQSVLWLLLGGAAAAIMLPAATGWWAVLPIGLAAVAAGFRLIIDPGDDTWGHVLWHALLAIALGTTPILLAPSL